jgi:hypothetical protein
MIPLKVLLLCQENKYTCLLLNDWRFCSVWFFCLRAPVLTACNIPLHLTTEWKCSLVYIFGHWMFEKPQFGPRAIHVLCTSARIAARLSPSVLFHCHAMSAFWLFDAKLASVLPPFPICNNAMLPKKTFCSLGYLSWNESAINAMLCVRMSPDSMCLPWRIIVCVLKCSS